jgi:non-ribosomal peptide synthetase component E (peptide arylation enzyme)
VVWVIDREGRDMPPGQAGEIACRIPGIANSTYHGDPAKQQDV